MTLEGFAYIASPNRIYKKTFFHNIAFRNRNNIVNNCHVMLIQMKQIKKDGT